MLISGVQPFTLLDYPEKVAAIVFTPGCNFRCGYCHNPEFVLPERIREIKDSFIAESVFLTFLEKRKTLLDGVVVSGGEPTIAPDLPEFAEKIKKLGFLVKLDTNGNRPEVIRKLIDRGLVDYVAMDVKMGLTGYRGLVGGLVKPEKIEESISLLKEGRVDYEFRSTLVKEVHTPEALREMRVMLAGAKRLYLQTFRPGHTLEARFGGYHPFSGEEMDRHREYMQAAAGAVYVR